MSDPFVLDKKGIFKYLLDNEEEVQLLNIRIFDDATKRSVYQTQTTKAKGEGISNCPLCAVGHASSANKIWKIE